MKNKSKLKTTRKAWILVSLVALLIIAGATYYFINSNAEKNKKDLNNQALNLDNKTIPPSPIASIEPDVIIKDVVKNSENTEKVDSDGFKMFSNDYYSMKYMGTNSLGDCDGSIYTDKCDIFSYHSSDNPVDSEALYGFHVSIGFATIDNYKEAVAYKFEDAGYFNISAPKNIIIDKEKAEIYSWTFAGEMGDYNGKDIFVSHNNKLYNITYTYEDSNNSNYSSTIQKMLSSFKFK